MSENVKNTETQNTAPSKGKRVVKAMFNTIIKILIVLVLVVSLLIAVMALTSKSSGISTIFGYTIQPIQSDSMKGGSPDGYKGGDFEKGDLMIAKSTNFDSSASYEKGDIVTFVSKDESGNKMLIVHRIVDVITNDAGTKLYQTQGDNRETSPVPDQTAKEYFLHPMNIGSVYYTANYEGKILKGWGNVLDFLQSQKGFFLVVLLPMIIFFMYALIRVVLSAAGYKKAKADEEKEEAVKKAVAAALAADDTAVQPKAVESEQTAAPSGMSAEELEQFRQFQEFQKMQKAQQQSEQTAVDTKPDTKTE